MTALWISTASHHSYSNITRSIIPSNDTLRINVFVFVRQLTNGVYLGTSPAPPFTVNGISFKNAEQLFQMMKLTDAEPINAVYKAANPKYTAKHWEKTQRRSDWGSIIVDAMKFCLSVKFEQNQDFRDTLLRTDGSFIVEDQTSFPKKSADTWGTKLVGGEYVGPNLLGRLLMELRDNSKLEYHLPENSLYFVKLLTI